MRQALQPQGQYPNHFQLSHIVTPYLTHRFKSCKIISYINFVYEHVWEPIHSLALRDHHDDRPHTRIAPAPVPYNALEYMPKTLLDGTGDKSCGRRSLREDRPRCSRRSLTGTSLDRQFGRRYRDRCTERGCGSVGRAQPSQG